MLSNNGLCPYVVYTKHGTILVLAVYSNQSHRYTLLTQVARVFGMCELFIIVKPTPRVRKNGRLE